METKGDIRKKILSIRNSIENKQVIEKSEIIINKLKSISEFKKSKTVFVYMDFKNEVKTLDLIEEMIKEKKRVVIPYTDVDNTVIIPVEINDINIDLKFSSFGYLEPKEEKVIPIDPFELDLIIVPGVAFDKELNRIGFGKGYYDRILSKKRNDAKAVAIAYEFQILDEIPSEEHDIKMDKIITEENIY
ncbi:5-formyltetrahydrofolate cyclo-ligase [Sedimentibacter acidaminivorans]|uniref:5-formyltetrahydrofolate cyclo-ligase n=1 Tax=Sedimentibacter acidaminivorans TaxID=913099 RepID=A0ABS4GFB3_9FIRM|nr:5-formyltetrahydrofolate cyclo-ligase [Sedimentibacter acidaminivorans]MBP1926232.1 5-formyltetrahydrofolate cyclo-ligase [Sedimentibacter acidaminivorans]